MKIQIKYYAYKIERGLLVEIEDRWGENVFNSYGYETEEEIYQRINISGVTQEVVIIKKVEHITW